MTAASPCVPMLEAILRPWQVGPIFLAWSAAGICDDRHTLPLFYQLRRPSLAAGAGASANLSRAGLLNLPIAPEAVGSFCQALCINRACQRCDCRKRRDEVTQFGTPRFASCPLAPMALPLVENRASLVQKSEIRPAQAGRAVLYPAMPLSGRSASLEAVRAACLGSPLRRK